MVFQEHQKKITEQISAAIKEEFQQDFPNESIRLETPPDQEMGDLAFPCFPLAKILKLPPPKIAARLADRMVPSPEIEKAAAHGGYLNLFYNKTGLIEMTLREIHEKKDAYGNTAIGNGQTILMEYSSPNTNKPLHLGHLRNNTLGMASANLLDAMGYRVIKVNLVNDRGVHICKSMLAYQKWGGGETPESTGTKGDHLVGKYYVLFETKLKENPDLDEEAQALLHKWESGDEETLSLWRRMNEWVYQGFRKTYSRMGTNFDKWYFESDTYRLGKQLVLEGLGKGIFYRREDGAVEIDLTGHGFDKKVLLRPNGTAVYMTQDLGTAKLKYEDYAFSRSLYVVANEQDYHFNVLFKILELLGFEWARGCVHLSYGMVELPEGKMKSREGTVVDADDLLDELKSMAREAILERRSDFGEGELESRAEEIGQGALKFFLLKVNPRNNIQFNPREALAFEGATGPYIQYSHARIQSILRKAGDISFDSLELSALGNKEEFSLARQLYNFPMEIQKAAEEYNPARVCEAALQIARELSKFYKERQVLKAESDELRTARLFLIHCAALALKKALTLLGIQAPDRM